MPVKIKFLYLEPLLWQESRSKSEQIFIRKVWQQRN